MVAAALARPSWVGGTGSSIYSGRLADLDPNTELRDRWFGDLNNLGIAAQMMRDSHVRQAVAALVNPIVSATWDFKPASKKPLDIEIADFCRYAFFERIKWTQAVRDVLHYVRDGFSLLEQTDDVASIPKDRFEKHPGGGKGIVLTGLHYRPGWTLDGWIQSKEDPSRLSAVRQRLPGSDEEKPGERLIPADRLLRFTWGQEGANFAGFAPLRSAYGDWFVKMTLRIVEGIRHEREHAGIPTIKLGDATTGGTEDNRREAETILADLRADEKSYLVLPPGFDFSWSTTQGTTDIASTIDRCDFGIAHNLGVGFMLLGKGGTAGSYALASTQSGQYEIGLDNHVRFIEDVFNLGSDGWSPVERIVRLNYGDDVQLPKLVARNMPTRDWSKILPIVNNLVLSGGIRGDDVLEEFIRDATYLPPLDPSSTRRLANQVGAQNLKADGMGNGDVAPTPKPGDPPPPPPPGDDDETGDLPTPKPNGKPSVGAVDEKKVAERLNAAQAAIVFEAIDKVAIGQLPRKAAVKSIAGAFLIDEAEVDAWFADVGNGFEPKATTMKIAKPKPGAPVASPPGGLGGPPPEDDEEGGDDADD